MASLTKRKVHGHVYYALVESPRINGKPRLVTQKFLGRVDQGVARLAAGPPVPTQLTVGEYRGSMTLLRIAERLHLVPHIDAAAPKRHQGPTVGAYLLVAAINRALAPTSQAKMADGYHRTALYHAWPFRASELTSQRFWDHRSYVDEACIHTIETDLTHQMVKEFGWNLETVVYDATNFYTWMDTMNPSELAQRGHQKQHRGDLKAVGVALRVTTDFNIPLFHAVYPGNRADSREFQTVTEGLIARYHAIASTCESITLVYDKGNNSQTNQAAVDQSPLHFVGSLKATQVPDLLKVDLAQFPPLIGAGFGGESADRTEREILGEKRTIVITYNEALYLGQWQGELLRLRKLHDRLAAIQAQ
jgi:transposase